MTELAALSTKLAALAAEDDVFVANGARIISKGGASAPLAAILQEVDNTVLERTLIFGIDDITLHVAVAGRRLRGIVEVEGDAPAIEAVVGEVMSREEPETLAAVGTLLAEICEAASQITVRSTPIRPIGNSGDAGVSASGLAALWQDAQGSASGDTSGSLVARFLAEQSKTLTGYLHFAGTDLQAEAGETAHLKEIWEGQVADFLDRHQKLRGSVDGPFMIGLDHALGPDNAVALARDEDEICLVICAPDNLPVLMSAWTKTVM